MKFVPDSKPQITIDKAMSILEKKGLDPKSKLCILGVRGYYLDTMGEPGKNDRQIYDDAIIILGPECFQTFNANTDPGYFRKGIANLKAGVWSYKVGTHGLNKPKDKQYTALVQAAKVTVIRDEVGPDTGMFGINIHRGGISAVSSLGCQTIHPNQWPSFIETVKSQLKKLNQPVVQYCLIEQE